MLCRYEFLTDPDKAEVRQIISLYRTADWWNDEDDADQDLVRRIVSGSHCFLAVKEGDAIVGMGRAISDGVNDAYLQDITVLPRFRHQDIGTRIVEMLVERLHLDGMRWIGLIAGSNSHPFYKKIGFEEMPFSTPMLLKQRTKV
jgi:aralkylamine N-acetyltransferase